MDKHLQPSDVCEVKALLRKRVPGDGDRFEVAFATIEARVVDAVAGWDHHPDDRPGDLAGFERDLRAGVRAGAPPVQDSGKRLPGRGSEVGDHEVARSCAIAEHAEQWHVVQRFRAECLPSGVLVSTEEVRAWMAQRHGDGPVEWVTLEGELGRSAVDPDTARSVNGAARQLRRTYGWSESLAVTFLLAGGVPIAPLVRVKVNGLGLLFDKQLPPTAGDAVVLTVHPDTPASEVAAAYSAAQARYWTRPRLLSSRMASAVTAAATLPTLAEANKSLGSGKKGQYRDTATFRGLVERARRRLVGLGEPVTVEAHEANLEASMEHSRRRTEELARL